MTGRPSRRAVLGGLAALSLPLAGCPDAGDENGSSPGGDGPDGGSTTPTDGSVPFEDLSLGATELAAGFIAPVAVEVPQPDRYFVVDQPGRIYLLADGERHTYLDLRDRIVALSGYEERGLLGLAFHPDFDDNGRLFVRYSAPVRSETPSNYDHTFVLSEFTADLGETAADPDSERTVLEIPEPQSNHNGGAITFGPDGYLYVGVGDGGGQNDSGTGHVEDWYDEVPGGNGQDVSDNLLGSVLRIDVDTRDGDRGYAVPDDNPLVGEPGRDEHYAWGFRNPWRMSFGPDGRLFVADVGQTEWEEVSVVERGGNYGWNVYEGTHCHRSAECPTSTADGDRLHPPVIEYPHEGNGVDGVAVIGGYLYDGDALPAFDGLYVFADWQARGRLFAARPADGGRWETTVVPLENDAVGPSVLGFGRDREGELLVCTTASGSLDGSTGAVYRLQQP